MTLKEDHTHSGKTLERFRTLIQTGGDEGSPRTQKRSLAQLGMHPGSNICAADNAGCVNSTYGFFLAKKKKKAWDLPGSSVAKTSRSQCRDLGSIPGQGNRSHILQLKISQAETRKIPRATTETQSNQIHKYFKNEIKKKASKYRICKGKAVSCKYTLSICHVQEGPGLKREMPEGKMWERAQPRVKTRNQEVMV